MYFQDLRLHRWRVNQIFSWKKSKLESCPVDTILQVPQKTCPRAGAGAPTFCPSDNLCFPTVRQIGGPCQEPAVLQVPKQRRLGRRLSSWKPWIKHDDWLLFCHSDDGWFVNCWFPLYSHVCSKSVTAWQLSRLVNMSQICQIWQLKLPSNGLTGSLTEGEVQCQDLRMLLCAVDSADLCFQAWAFGSVRSVPFLSKVGLSVVGCCI